MFDQLRLSFNAIQKCKIAEKYQHARRVVCAYVYDFRKRPGCALIGACALIRTNTVVKNILTQQNFDYILVIFDEIVEAESA